jgi:Co/Zn/Cd efflux system component
MTKEQRVLWLVLGINFLFFLIEFILGNIHNSVGLMEDSFDMLADAIIYGLSLLALSGCICKKIKLAKAVGFTQLALVLYGFGEIVKRFLGYAEMPDYNVMIAVSVFALAGNVISLALLQKLHSDDINIKASVICSSKDVLSNIGVIIAGVLVLLTNSFIPDLVIGLIILYLVAGGVREIFEETRKLAENKCDLHTRKGS